MSRREDWEGKPAVGRANEYRYEPGDKCPGGDHVRPEKMSRGEVEQADVGEIGLTDLLLQLGIVSTEAAARDLLEGAVVYLNGRAISDVDARVALNHNGRSFCSNNVLMVGWTVCHFHRR